MAEIDLSCSGVEHDGTALLADAERLIPLAARPDDILSIVLCNDAFIRPLNLEWRGKDVATDVLSFAQNEGEGMFDSPVLGDLVISVETAQRQASELGHSLEEELRVLLVHGLCHLVGFDHIDAADAAEMREEEQRLLQALGVSGLGLVTRAGA